MRWLRSRNYDPSGESGVRLTRLFRKAAPAVVLIVTNDALGSGTLLKRGGILTNAHVVGAAKQVAIIFRPVDVRAPNQSDIILGDVLRIDEVKDLARVHPATVPESANSMEVDDTDAFEIGADTRNRTPDGRVLDLYEGHHQSWTTEKGGIEHKATVIQTQTPINPGNSGGPLISDDDKLIGVNSFKAQGEGLNYAVAAKSVREFLAATPSARVSGGETVAQAPQQGGSQAACEPKLLFEGRSADDKSSMRQFSLRCDDTVDLTIVEPDNKKEPFLPLMDTERRGKIDAIVLDPRRKYHWEKSFWGVDFDDTFRLVGLHRNGEFQPYRFEKVAPERLLRTSDVREVPQYDNSVGGTGSLLPN
jgi:hypothetical protein